MKLFPLFFRAAALSVSTTLLMAIATLSSQAAISDSLQRGQSGDNVRILQRELIRQGYLAEGLETGVFGELTEAAVKMLQADQGLSQDGIVGAATLRSLGLSSGHGGARPQVLSSNDVQTLQARLVALKFDPGPVDGVVGSQTEEAIEAFQRRNNEPIDPVASANTLEQVSRVYERQLRLGSIRSVEDLNLPLPAASENGPVAIVQIPRPRQEGIPETVSRFRDDRQEGADPNDSDWIDAGNGSPLSSPGPSTAQLPRPVDAQPARPSWEPRSSWEQSEIQTRPTSSPAFRASAPVSSSPYIIAIPGETWELLSEVQAFSPSAFQSENRRGPFIQAGAFSDRGEAEAEERYLRSKGFDARVIFTSR